MMLNEFVGAIRGNVFLHIKGSSERPMSIMEFFYRYRGTTPWLSVVDKFYISVIYGEYIFYEIYLRR